ncbi:MAG: hypothetical protein MUO50_12835, partial [Longimicrobiales bacterium]|nr:hypothetical protein [Longimicrobiales bacterium]
LEDSRSLARTMTRLGEVRGVRTTALVTGMDVPLGRAVGNGLETREALRCLAGGGPEDLADLSAALVGEMLYLGGLEKSPEAGTLRAGEALAQGRALERMARLIEFQGGDPNVVEDPLLIPPAPEVEVLTARTSGFVSGICPVSLGYGVVELGGGRRRLGDSVDLRVGFVMEVRLGDWVEAGDPLGEVHAADTNGIEKGLGILENAVTLEPAPRRLPSSLILERVQGSE